MAQWWTYTGDGWLATPLDAYKEQALCLMDDPESPVAPLEETEDLHGCVLLVRPADSADAWAVAANGNTVRVNGEPVLAGLRRLHDFDLVALPGRRVAVFSSERLARVQPLPASGGPVHCARCGGNIEEGAPAIACPQCGVWYHQDGNDPDYQCWTFATHCAFDNTPTALGGAFRRSPEDL